MTTKWTKYTFVCNGQCDALIEYTLQAGYTFNDVTSFTCVCGSNTTLLSVDDATIYPTTTKEESMETTSLLHMVTKEYLQNEIDTLKKQLASHQNCDYWKSENGRIGSQLINLVNDAYDNDAESEEILNSICEIIDYNPTKTVQFEGVIHFSGSIDIPRNEVADFDLTETLDDVYVDINNGNVCIDNYELYSVEEPY